VIRLGGLAMLVSLIDEGLIASTFRCYSIRDSPYMALYTGIWLDRTRRHASAPGDAMLVSQLNGWCHRQSELSGVYHQIFQ
jgi:hypothetical protein